MPEEVVRAVTVNDVSSLLNVLGELGLAASVKSESAMPRVLYRGHRVATWRLIPLFHRELEHPSRSEYVNQYALTRRIQGAEMSLHDHSSWSETSREQWYKDAHRLMHATMNRFVSYALSAKQLTGVAAVEAARALNVAGAERAAITVKDSPTLVGLSQHHGLPTTLLDWTGDPHVALWFIVDDLYREQANRRLQGMIELQPHELAEVWGMPRTLFSGGSPRLQIMADQAYPTAQSGLFTSDEAFKDDYTVRGQFISLDERLVRSGVLTAATPIEHRPFRVRFPYGIVGELLAKLQASGHCTATLKPSLDNIALFAQRLITP